MNNDTRPTFSFGGISTSATCLGLALILGHHSATHAQDANELARQQMEAMKQVMEAQGMSAEELESMEEMYKQSMGPIVEAQAAQEAQVQADFEAENAELGKAFVSLPDRDIELQVTECVTLGGNDFRIRGQATYDSRSDSIWIGGETHYKRTVLQMFLKGVGEFDIEIRPMVGLEDGRFSWSGTADGGRGPKDVTVTAECRPGS